MDMQKSAASRVRHILQAMERSIDSARSRRVHDHGAPVPLNGTTPQTSRPANNGDAAGSWPHAAVPQQPRMAIPSAPSADSRTIPSRDNGALIGGSPAAARPIVKPVDPNQPARLKAKPKRFEGTFASQFAPPAQPEYRSQAG